MRWSLRALFALQAAYIIVFTILPAFTCSPLHYAWVPTERNAHCSLLYWYYTLEGLFAASLALDGLLLFFPIVPIAKLQMPLKKRLGTILIFVLGTASVLPISSDEQCVIGLLTIECRASVACAYKLAVWVIEWSLRIPPGIPDCKFGRRVVISGILAS